MIKKVIIAGEGGQGIMIMGKVLAEAAMREGRSVTWFPSYGAEVRGGTANCMVVISDEEIGSPYIDNADCLIVMNEPSYKRFQSRLEDNGLLIINSSLVRSRPKAGDYLEGPFTEIALECGNIKMANMAALGLFIAETKLVTLDTVNEVIKDYVPKGKDELIASNKKALMCGAKLLRH